MAKRVKITNQGLSLLASSSQATGQYYWLGYYALAYVPNLWKTESVVLPPVDTCNNVNGTPTIESTDTDNISSTMTRLTKYGDVIYNIWQGDLSGTGYAGGASDGSAGGDLFGLTMYNKNIKKHYRYVLDSNGNNTLVGWVTDASKTDGSMLGKHVYKGTDAFTYSEMPIPAPLYYLGDTSDRSTVDKYFDEYPSFEDVEYNGSGIYPYITVTLTTNTSDLDVPKVSTDFRGYTDSLGNPAVLPYAAPGAYFDTTEIPSGASASYDVLGWYAGNTTFGVGASDDDYYYCREFWKLHTISNYNRFHAPVDSIGHVLQSDLSNRNMAKVTKFFPISNYKVINTETKFTSNSESVEVATAIKLGIDIDLSPSTLSKTSDDLNGSSNSEFFNAYENAGSSDVSDQYNQSIYLSTHTSFKFNRIGIYAVPMRTAAYVSDEGFGFDTKDKKLQFQINPDQEPVLFAVIDWDNTIVMSDTGDGIHQFSAEVDVNLESPDNADTTALIRDASIFYNLYQDDAQTWYQNQLITSASTSNAITELGLELAHIKNIGSAQSCCPTPDLSKLYASINHTHQFLRNIKDSNNRYLGGLKGIDTAQEGTILDSDAYELGDDSVVFGLNTYVNAKYSMIGNGENNYINKESNHSFIGAGKDNRITLQSIESLIGAGHNNLIESSSYSMIGVAIDSDIKLSQRSGILGGGNNHILGTSTGGNIYNLIGYGYANGINQSSYATIFNGTANIIDSSNNATIINGSSNYINSASFRSFIGNGLSNTIIGSYDSSILGGSGSIIDSAIRSFIGGGDTNYIGSASYNSCIGGGKLNYIKTASDHSGIVGGENNSVAGKYGFIGGGLNNLINANASVIVGGVGGNVLSEYSIIGAGYHNYIYTDSIYSGIFSGATNSIIGSDDAFIGSGTSNVISSGNYSSILGGANNYIGVADYSCILGGFDNDVTNYINVGIYGTGISANRSNAFIVNSLTLYDNTFELFGETPEIGDVLRVKSLYSTGVATLEWGKNGYNSSYINLAVEATDTSVSVVLSDTAVINIQALADITNIDLNESNLNYGQYSLVTITTPTAWTSACTLTWEMWGYGSYSLSLSASRYYTFQVIRVGSYLSLVGDYAGTAI